MNKNLKSVSVIGLYAQEVKIWLGNCHGTPSNPVRVLQGIKNKYVVRPGKYRLMVGSSSSNIRLNRTITVVD